MDQLDIAAAIQGVFAMVNNRSVYVLSVIFGSMCLCIFSWYIGSDVSAAGRVS